MVDIRFELKDIDDGKRGLDAAEERKVQELLDRQLTGIAVGDAFNPGRKILVPSIGSTVRVLEGALGIDGSSSRRWNERHFDDFFERAFTRGAYYWFQPDTLPVFRPLFWAPYSSKRRDYLYVYAMEWGMRPCGITGVDGNISIMSSIDDDYTIAYGSEAEMQSLDVWFGGREQICEDLSAFLATAELDYGEGSINAYLSQILPLLGGCVRTRSSDAR